VSTTAQDRTAAVRLVVDGPLAWVTLDRPEAINAITVALARDLEATLLTAADTEGVRVVLIRGAGGNFCAGGDFDEVQRLRAAGPGALPTLFERFAAACAVVGEIRQPVIAVVEGVATAGGFELMQACDIALVREDARICDNHVRFGMVPGGGGSQRLPRLVGRQRALGHLLSGDRLTGADAVSWGLAYRSYAADEFEVGVEQFAADLAARRPDAVAGMKRLVRDGLAGSLEDGLALEIDTVVAHIAGEAGAGVSSFAGRRSAGGAATTEERR
jgi:enoyl-CoA hydratase/carnithine racemase